MYGFPNRTHAGVPTISSRSNPALVTNKIISGILRFFCQVGLKRSVFISEFITNKNDGFIF